MSDSRSNRESLNMYQGLSRGFDAGGPSHMPDFFLQSMGWGNPENMNRDMPTEYLGHVEAAAYLALQHQQHNAGPSVQIQPRPAAKKRGRPSGSSKAVLRDGDSDDRNTTVQEKNRQAQARFRERQKEKMSVLESRVEELEGRNQQVTEEMRALQSRKNVLEKVLSMKDEQLQQLQTARQSDNRVAETHQLPLMSQSLGANFEMNPLSVSAVVKLWTHYTKGLSDMLAEVDKKADKDTARTDIENMTTDAFHWFQSLSMSDANAANLLVSSPLCEPSEHATLHPGHWQNVVRALQVSDHQRQAILALTHDFKMRASALFTSQRREMEELMTGVPHLDRSCLVASQSVKSAGAAARLQVALNKVTQQHIEYIGTILDRTLDKVQLAKAFVYSYPFFPDPLIISQLLDGISADAATQLGLE